MSDRVAVANAAAEILYIRLRGLLESINFVKVKPDGSGSPVNSPRRSRPLQPGMSAPKL